MDFISTVKGAFAESVYPEAWDFEKIDACCSHAPEEIFERQTYWNTAFHPILCENVTEFNMMLGHEIAYTIKKARENKEKLIMIFPVGPMGRYNWSVYFLKEWRISCDHIYGFNMDEWSDQEGNTLDAADPAAFQNAMETAFYGPLGELTVPPEQRNFATKENLPLYPEKIAELKARGAKQVTIYGIGRMCHIAFWEPHFGQEFSSVEEWKKCPYKLGARLHPFTVEQNAITSFKSRISLVSCRANTIGPGIFLQSDYMIGGADGILGRGMQWQGMPLWMTLRYGPDKAVTSSFVPTLPGKLFFVKELAGPLVPECN